MDSTSPSIELVHPKLRHDILSILAAVEGKEPERAAGITKGMIEKHGYMSTLESLIYGGINDSNFLKSHFNREMINDLDFIPFELPPDEWLSQIEDGNRPIWMSVTISLHAIEAFKFLYDLRSVPEGLFERLYFEALLNDPDVLRLLIHKAKNNNRFLPDQTIQLEKVLNQKDGKHQREIFGILLCSTQNPSFEINGIDANGLTALHIALKHDSELLMDLLKKEGADMSHCGNVQQSPNEIIATHERGSAVFEAKKKLIVQLLNNYARNMLEDSTIDWPKGFNDAVDIMKDQIGSVWAGIIGQQTIKELMGMSTRNEKTYDSIKKLQKVLFKFYKMFTKWYESEKQQDPNLHFSGFESYFLNAYTPKVSEHRMSDLEGYLYPKSDRKRISKDEFARRLKNYASRDCKNKEAIYNLIDFFIPDLTSDSIEKFAPPLICFLIVNLSVGDLSNLDKFIHSQEAFAWRQMRDCTWGSGKERRENKSVAWTRFEEECARKLSVERLFCLWHILWSSLFVFPL